MVVRKAQMVTAIRDACGVLTRAARKDLKVTIKIAVKEDQE